MSGDNFKHFLRFILNDNQEGFRQLLPQIDLTQDDEQGISALHYAAEAGNLLALDAILETRRIDANKLTLQSGSTALMQAAMHGHLLAVERLLEAGADPRIISRTGYTALMMAVEAGAVDCVKVLMRYNSDLNTVNTNGDSISTLAVKYPTILALVLSSGQVQSSTCHEASPLHSSHLTIEAAQLLLDYGFNVNFMDASGDTPLGAAIKNQNMSLAEYLIRSGADLMLVSKHGESVFELAALHDDSEVFLRKHKCPITFLPSVIIACAAKSRLELMKTLANAEEIASVAPKAFVAASQNGSLNCVLFLAGLVIDDVEILFTGAQSAIACGHMSVFRSIFDFVCKNASQECREDLQRSLSYLLLTAAECGEMEAVQFLLEQGIPVDGDGSEGCTPLIAASASGALEVVQLLLSHGAKVNAEHELGGTALIVAATNGHVEIVRELLAHGADSSIKDSSGFTPLLAATLYNHIDIVNLLLSKSLQVNSASNEGFSPLLAAASIGDDRVVDRFLQLGAELEQCDVQGNTALHIAAEKGHLRTISFLLKRGFGMETFCTVKNRENATPLQLLINSQRVDLIEALLAEFPDLSSERVVRPSVQPVEPEHLCLICRDEMEAEALVLPCRHEFHSDCFEEWSKLHPKCPTCKRFPYRAI